MQQMQTHFSILLYLTRYRPLRRDASAARLAVISTVHVHSRHITCSRVRLHWTHACSSQWDGDRRLPNLHTLSTRAQSKEFAQFSHRMFPTYYQLVRRPARGPSVVQLLLRASKVGVEEMVVA
jgi:hypothetical protein